jgi:hypothetical protein
MPFGGTRFMSDFLALLCLILILGFALACGGGDSDSSPESEPELPDAPPSSRLEEEEYDFIASLADEMSDLYGNLLAEGDAIDAARQVVAAANCVKIKEVFTVPIDRPRPYVTMRERWFKSGMGWVMARSTQSDGVVELGELVRYTGDSSPHFFPVEIGTTWEFRWRKIEP